VLGKEAIRCRNHQNRVSTPQPWVRFQASQRAGLIHGACSVPEYCVLTAKSATSCRRLEFNAVNTSWFRRSTAEEYLIMHCRAGSLADNEVQAHVGELILAVGKSPRNPAEHKGDIRVCAHLLLTTRDLFLGCFLPRTSTAEAGPGGLM
jgi:hypothetical protein